MPVAGDFARLNQRLGGSKAHQNHHGREHRNRRGRVQRDAQLAMVGIAVYRMDVRHLDDGQQRQQGQTKQSGCPESPWLPAVAPAVISLESCQSAFPYFKNTQYWTRQQRRGLLFLPRISSHLLRQRLFPDV